VETGCQGGQGSPRAVAPGRWMDCEGNVVEETLKVACGSRRTQLNSIVLYGRKIQLVLPARKLPREAIHADYPFSARCVHLSSVDRQQVTSCPHHEFPEEKWHGCGTLPRTSPLFRDAEPLEIRNLQEYLSL
jgi:hypothetical protein